MMVRKMRRFPFGARTPDFRQESELINMKRSKCNRLLHRAALLFTVLVFAASTFAASASATEITPVPDPTTPVESTADPGVPGDSTVNPIIPNTDPNTPADPTVPSGTDPNAETPVDPNNPTTPTDPGISPPFDPNAPVTSPGEETPPTTEPPTDPNAPVNPDGTTLSDGTESLPEGTESSDTEASEPVEEEPVEEEPYQPPVSQRPSVIVDTDNDEINENASRAAEATDDPDLLSSQDWSELLTSGEVSQSPDAKPFENIQQQENQSGSNTSQGSFSWILPVGILLIVLGLGGIAFFVYAQFFAPRRRAAFDDTGEIQEFTDISSDSSGVQQREDYLFGGESEPEDLAEPEEEEQIPTEEPQDEAVTEEGAPPVGALTEEAPIQKNVEIAEPEVRFIPDAKPGEMPREESKDAAANPYGFKVEIMKDQKDENGNFDWDAFFDNGPNDK